MVQQSRQDDLKYQYTDGDRGRVFIGGVARRPVPSSFSTVTYQATVPTYFGGIVGYPTISVSGVSSATIATNAYVSVTFLLDNSSSMLIASTQAGVTLMDNSDPR